MLNECKRLAVLIPPDPSTRKNFCFPRPNCSRRNYPVFGWMTLRIVIDQDTGNQHLSTQPTGGLKLFLILARAHLQTGSVTSFFSSFKAKDHRNQVLTPTITVLI
jgi:hypothetical protein